MTDFEIHCYFAPLDKPSAPHVVALMNVFDDFDALTTFLQKARTHQLRLMSDGAIDKVTYIYDYPFDDGKCSAYFRMGDKGVERWELRGVNNA